MPKLKSIIAGLAVSTAMSGAVVGLGAATTASSAGAATNLSSGTSTLAWSTCSRFTRCGGWRSNGWRSNGWRNGWRHQRFPRIRIIIINRNRNTNHPPRA
jgi:hypothetical protein